MSYNTIAFPNLGLSFEINRVAVHIGNLQIYWYALCIVAGILLGAAFCTHIAKKENLNPDAVSDVVLWGIPSALIFARAYYVIFNFAGYKDDLSSIFKIYEGGIAIYGAIIGAALCAYIYARVKKIPPLKLFDVCSYGLLIGQAIGRWGNFTNQEAYGGNTNNILAMTGGKIQAELSDMQRSGMNINPDMGVHPTFLYESLWNALGFILLIIIRKKLGEKRKDGQLFLIYVTWYGIGRFFIEGLRLDSLMLGSMRISQVVAIVSVAVCSALIYYITKKENLHGK